MKIKHVMHSLLYVAVASASLQSLAANASTAVYASYGEELQHYSLNDKSGSLTLDETVKLPATIQFAVADASRKHLYVISSNMSATNPGDVNTLNAFSIAPKTGRLTPLGEPVKLKERPIHMTLDRNDHFALVAYNQSGTVTVHPILENGGVGEAVQQDQPVHTGIFTHQVTVMPSNQFVLVPGRGNDADKGKPEDIGTLTTFAYKDGKLTQVNQVQTPPGIGPRHTVYSPTMPLAYIGMERGSAVWTYKIADNGQLAPEPIFKISSIDPHWKSEPNEGIKKGGVIRISDDGKHLYTNNRSDSTDMEGNRTVFRHGENDVAVFALDAKTGEPKLLQEIDTRGLEARTFTIDPEHKRMIVGNQKSGWVKKDGKLVEVKANLAVFKIKNDGTLTFEKKYDMKDPQKPLMWVDSFKVNP